MPRPHGPQLELTAQSPPQLKLALERPGDQARGPGQIEVTIEYFRHVGPRYIHGGLTLSFRFTTAVLVLFGGILAIRRQL